MPKLAHLLPSYSLPLKSQIFSLSKQTSKLSQPLSLSLMAPKSKKPAYHQVARKPVHPDPLVQQWIESNPKTLFIDMLKQADDTPDPLEK